MTPAPALRSAGVTLCLLAWLLAATAAAQTVTFTRLGTIPGRADLVEIHNGHAYVVEGKTLALFDLSNPAAPVRRGAYTFPEKIWGIRVVGTLVYVAADFYGLGILDVSNVQTPTLRGMLKTPGQAKSVALVGGTALVADHMTGVDVIDVTTVQTPVNRGSFFLDGYARDVTSAGGLAYAIDAPTGLYVFDLANATRLDALEPTSSQQSATSPASIELMTAPAAGGAPQLAVLVGGGSLQIYDVTDPKAPVRAAVFRTASGRPARATLQGAVAYVADGAEGLQVVDLSVPAVPRVIGAFKTSQPARDVAVADTLVAVAVGRADSAGEVLILRQQP